MSEPRLPGSPGGPPKADPDRLDELFAGHEGFRDQERPGVTALWSALDALEEPPTPPLAPPAAIHQDLAATASARQRLPIAVGVLAAFVVGSAAAMGLREDARPILSQLSAVAFMGLGAALLAMGARLGGLRRPMGLGLLAAGIALFGLQTAIQLATEAPNAEVTWDQMGCVEALLLWSLPGAALVAWALRGARFPTPLTGAILGTGVGFFGASMLELHCPVINPLHLLLHHGGGIALMGLLGAAVAAALLRRSLAQP